MSRADKRKKAAARPKKPKASSSSPGAGPLEGFVTNFLRSATGPQRSQVELELVHTILRGSVPLQLKASKILLAMQKAESPQNPEPEQTSDPAS